MKQMKRYLLLLLVAQVTLPVFAQQPQWIWFPEGKPAESTPAGAVRFFRKTFELADEIVAAKISVTADDHFLLLINGREVLSDDGQADGWQRLRVQDVAKNLVRGKNSLAIKGTNGGASPAGVVAWLDVTLKGGQKLKVVSDATWRTSNQLEADLKKWWELGYDDTSWKTAMSLGELGKTAPWGDRVAVATAKTPAERFTVPEGFVIEQVTAPSKELGSLVCMTFDPKGRLTVSREGGAIEILDGNDKNGKTETIKVFSDKVKNCQGLLWVGGDLFANGDGPQGTGLYRLKDTDGDAVADEIKCLGKYRGGMGEHGPHGIVLGPDNHLYIALGNHVQAPADVAADSPLNRFYEGELLRGYEDPNGHAVGIRTPGGTVARVDLDGKRWERFAGGFRNHYDHAFNSEGELFGFDSDMEWDVGVPWYRPTRVNHIIQGGDYGWRSGTACMPDYYFDTLPTTVDIGRGSPTGVTFYNHTQFPEKYRGALFIADWSMGRIIAVTLKKNGASYIGTWEPFVTGKPLNVADLEAGPDGSLYFITGGRGTEGAVFRVRSEKSDVGRVTSRGENLMRSRRSISLSEAVKSLVHPNSAERKNACESIVRFLTDDQNMQLQDSHIKQVLPILTDVDSFARWSARQVLGRTGQTLWQDAIMGEKNIRAALEGMISLCTNSDDKAVLGKIADKSLALLGQKLADDELLDLLRVIQVAHIKARGDKGDRSGGTYVPLAADAKIAAELSKRFPTSDWQTNRELARLMIYLNAPDAKNKILAELEKQRSADVASGLPMNVNEEKRNQPRENQIHYAYCLGAANPSADGGWSAEQKKQFATWFEHASKWQGGHSFKGFLEYILADWEKTLSDDERTTLLAWHSKPLAKTVAKKPAPKPKPAKKFSFDEIVQYLESADGQKGSAEKGKAHYESRQCARCHKHGAVGQGGLGPDLTTVSSRFKRRDMLDAILLPSKVISDQYRSYSVKTKDGEIASGLLAVNNDQKIELLQSDGTRVTIPKGTVENMGQSDVSLMPADLLDGLALAEIADLIAFLESAK